MRILVAEDEELLLELYKRYLKAYQVTYCNDGAAAYSAILSSQLRREEFDLIITDLMMPFRSGHDLVDSKFLPENKPVIVVSGFVEQEMINKIAKTPHFHLFEKPILWKDFMALVRSFDPRAASNKP